MSFYGKKIPTLNPCLLGLRLFVDNVLWNVRPISRASRKKLESLKNKYEGEKAVVLCNGPSLLDVNFNLLDNVYTFGLNKVNLLFNKTQFRPSSIVAVNPFVIEQNKRYFSDADIDLFLDNIALEFKLPITKENIIYLQTNGYPIFIHDCSKSVSQGYTVTYVALQLAYHMGFHEVCLVGCDHSYYRNGEPNKEYVATGLDKSHFDDSYFSNGQIWQFPDLEQSEISYKMAKVEYEKDNRKIYNASTTTYLDIFPRVDLEEFLGM